MIYPTTKEDKWGESLYAILEEHFPKIPWSAGDMSGYVYLLAYELEPKIYKIGVSKHPWKRIRELKAQFPLDVDVLAIGLFDHYETVETEIHGDLKAEGKHIKGEWFALDPIDLAVYKQLISGGQEKIGESSLPALIEFWDKDEPQEERRTA